MNNSSVNYDQLWDFFQEADGRDIYASQADIYLGSIPKKGNDDESSQKCWVCINGPEDSYPYQYCKKREDLPEMVKDFFSEGGSIEDINRKLDWYANRKKNST